MPPKHAASGATAHRPSPGRHAAPDPAYLAPAGRHAAPAESANRQPAARHAMSPQRWRRVSVPSPRRGRHAPASKASRALVAGGLAVGVSAVTGVAWAASALGIPTVSPAVAAPVFGTAVAVRDDDGTWAEQRAAAFDVDGVLPRPDLPAASDTVPSGVAQAPDVQAILAGAAPTVAVSGISLRVLQAYHSAADRTAKEQPRCGIGWSLLAGIGRVETGHATFGGATVDAAGHTSPAIYGPRLDGGPGMAAIRDTDGGRYDGDTQFDRAVGPMQFIPGTWAHWGADANGDGTADPQDVDDAALSAARYLCAAGGDLHHPEGIVKAVYSYNNSADYVRLVLTLAAAYGATTPQALGTDLLPPPSPAAPVTVVTPVGAAAPVAPLAPAAPAAPALAPVPSQTTATAQVQAAGGSASASTLSSGEPSSGPSSQSASPTPAASAATTPSGSATPSAGTASASSSPSASASSAVSPTASVSPTPTSSP